MGSKANKIVLGPSGLSAYVGKALQFLYSVGNQTKFS